MTPHQEHPFAHAEQTAHNWLATVAQEMETDNLAAAHRALRAWLHVVRDRLTPDSLAHLGAQLPALLRGILFDGWVPAHTPVRYDASEFVARFAHEAGIAETEVPNAAAGVTRALEIVRKETDTTMALMGERDIRNVGLHNIYSNDLVKRQGY